MKKYFFILILITVFLSGCAKQRTDQPNANLTENNSTPIMVKMLTQTDKSTYRSYEKINLSINIISDRDLENILIKAQGINNDFNRSYFNQNKTVNLKKQSPQSITLSQILPACNSCSGLSPGQYDITVTASYQGQTLDQASIGLDVAQ